MVSSGNLSAWTYRIYRFIAKSVETEAPHQLEANPRAFMGAWEFRPSCEVTMTSLPRTSASRPPDCRKVLACLRRLQEPGKYFKSRKQSRLNQHLHSTAITSGALATNYLSEWNVVPLISCRAPVSFTSRHVRRSVPQSHQATHYIDRHLTAVKMSHSVPL